MLALFNTATRKVEPVIPRSSEEVTLYTCGVTAYGLTHIGHLRAYLMADLLRRTLALEGNRVRQVMNVTDVGHLVDDGDAGEDRMEKGARREGTSPWELSRRYENHFFQSIHEMNIEEPEVIARATEHIEEMIALVRRLESRGATYRTSVGLIFDTARFPRYAEFARLNLEGQQAGARTLVDDERRNPSDFALWVTNQPHHIMQWESPWGRGFPGWHVECSAMAMRYLGEQIDIHTGGVDHIPIHHTNEIAQSETATGKTFARYWMHTEFLQVDGTKMSKSLDNLFTLDDLRARGFHPLALRLLFLGSHYRTQLDFRWETLAQAQTVLVKLWQTANALPAPSGHPLVEHMDAFRAGLDNDQHGSNALMALWQMLDSSEAPERKARTLYEMDRVLGLDLAKARTRLQDLHEIQGNRPGSRAEAERLMRERLKLKAEKRYAEADAMRARAGELGFAINDTPQGPELMALFR